jgi:methionine sulfoxide reductase heme-binding subunit
MTRDWILLGLAAIATSLLLSLGLAGGSGAQLPWYLSRASGLVAFALLTGSMVMGLLITTKAADGIASRSRVFDAHQFMSVAAIGFIALHGGALLFDGFFHFTPLSLLIPFASPYLPLWTGLGVIGAWLTVGVTASFWMRGRIGQRRWRMLHFATFGAYVLAFVHGFSSGTDTQQPLVFWMYVFSGAAIGALLAYRIAVARAKRQAPATSMARRAAVSR